MLLRRRAVRFPREHRDRAMSSIKKQQRWTSFLSFADYFLAVYSQATVSLTWERAEELVTTQWGRCALHLLTPAGENRLLKFQEFLSQWLNRTITKSKLCELTIKYIILKPKVTNTENSSLPNYLTTLYYFYVLEVIYIHESMWFNNI